MHQTFYIDIDEEITSIVERLKKSKTKDIVIVVPKRALLIQSIINLKLLKKEADKLKKEIIIVTQDKLGKLLVEKTGIVVEQKIDEVEGEEIIANGEQSGANVIGDFSEEKRSEAERVGLEELGSTEYFDTVPKKNKRPILAKEDSSNEEEKILNKELVTDFDSGIRNKFFFKKTVQNLDMVRNIDIKQKGQEKEESVIEKDETKHSNILKREKLSFDDESEVDILPNKKAEDFFSRNERQKPKEKEVYKNVQVGSRIWKIFFWFCFVVFLAGAAAFGYLYLPKAVITITPKTETKSIDFELKGATDFTDLDYEKQTIPVKIFDLEDEITQSFEVTGTKSDTNKKARGTITIYNEFSSSPQPLVATTRFLSESGKLFRLEKSIVVPGTTQVGGEIKPGAIEAEIIADEAGSSYNVGPSKFSIPGFQGSGSDKYNKIYAKSSKPMMGGGDSGENVKSISASDISSAKNKIGKDLMDDLKLRAKNEKGDEYIVLEDAMSFSDIVYSPSATEGTVTDSFSLTAKARVSVFILKRTSLEALVINKITSSTSAKPNQINKDSIKFEFGKSDADFSKGTILIRVNIKAKIISDFDVKSIKKDILGKNEEEFKAYMSRFKGIEDIYINYQPAFISGKIPQYESRVEMILDNN